MPCCAVIHLKNAITSVIIQKMQRKEGDAMSEENFAVAINTAALVAAKIKATVTEYEGKYVLDDEVYKRVLGTYKMFRKFALQNDGGIKNVDVRGADKAKIVAEVPAVDLFRDGLVLFTELLAMVDFIDVSASRDGGLIIKVCVAGLWKAV